MKRALRRISRLVPARAKELAFRGSFAAMHEAQRDDLRRAFQMASVDASLRNLSDLGFLPRRIVDVGAYDGTWTTMAKELFPAASVLMVEAQPKKMEALRAVERRFPGSVRSVTTLLGPEARQNVPFFELETGSSVLPERSGYDRVRTTLEMDTLDRVVERIGFDPVDFLKIDVQGYELEVLKGGGATLAGAEAVLLEASLIEMNEGAPLVGEVLSFMSARGFTLYDICSLMRRPRDGALCQVDLLFLKDGSPLRGSPRYDESE